MAFAGVPVFTFIQESGQGTRGLRVTGVTLGPFAGAFDPTGAAPDSGLFNSNNGAIDPVPANTISLPTTFGSGQDNWSAEDLNALLVMLNDAVPVAGGANMAWYGALIANVNPLPAGSTLTNANVRVGLHSRGASPVIGIQAVLNLIHTLVR